MGTFIIFLLGSFICEVNWQAAFEDAHVLVGHNFKWFFGPCNQLHFNVVSSSDRCYNIQVKDAPSHGKETQIGMTLSRPPKV